jgi:predicted methyltransferase
MNLHNWITDGNADEVIQEFHRVLKPGGVLGVVDHRADPPARPPNSSRPAICARTT